MDEVNKLDKPSSLKKVKVGDVTVSMDCTEVRYLTVLITILLLSDFAMINIFVFAGFYIP